MAFATILRHLHFTLTKESSLSVMNWPKSSLVSCSNSCKGRYSGSNGGVPLGGVLLQLLWLCLSHCKNDKQKWLYSRLDLTLADKQPIRILPLHDNGALVECANLRRAHLVVLRCTLKRRQSRCRRWSKRLGC